MPTDGSRPRLSLDIETHGDIDVLHPVERPLVCVGMFDGHSALIIPRHLLGPAEGSGGPYDGNDQPWPEYLRLLARFDLELHNGMFDIPTLCARLAEPDVDPEYYGVSIGFDTMLAHYVMRPAAEQGLKPLAKTLLGVDDWDQLESFVRLSAASFDNREDWWKYAYPALDDMTERHGPQPTKLDMKDLGEMPEFMVHLYNAYDVLHTWQVRDAIEPMLNRREEMGRASDHLHEFARGIMWDELEGFPVDRQQAKKLVAILTEEVDALRDKLIQWAHTYVADSEFPRGCFNPNSWQQVIKVYASVGLTLKSTGEKTMTKLSQKGDQFAETLLAFRSVSKELNTYAIKAVRDTNSVHGEPRLYPWYQLTRTLTGRLSSSGVTNMQNWSKQEDLPPERRLRSLLVASRLDVPRTLVQVDYSQAELRVMAAVSGDDWLTGIFSDPSLDIFTQMTKDIFPEETDDKKIKLWRRPLKSVVYGLAFGRKAPAIGVELGIPIQQAQTIMDEFLRMADELNVWRKWVMRQAVTCGDLTTRFGRHFQHEVVTHRNKAAVQRSALSFIPQSTASDITLKAYVSLRRWVKIHQPDWIFRAVVHDALTYDVPAHQADYAIEVISHFMTEAAKEVIPEVPFAVDGNAAQAWSLTG